MDGRIEAAFRPGGFVSYYDASSLVCDLERIEAEISKLTPTDPTRAVRLYEALLAGCDVTADEIDDSDGEFGTFAGTLFLGWIKARQAAEADRGETAGLLLKFMEEDSYGFCNDLELSAVKVLDRTGLEAFEREVRARFDKACAAQDERKRQREPNPNYYVDHWAAMLKAIYSRKRDVGKYIDLTAQAGLTRNDCGAIAEMLQSKRKPIDALGWVERGLGIGERNTFGHGRSHQLGEMRRALLVKVGRGDAALESAWAEFKAHPGEFTYEELIRYVPRAERGAWHEKAMEASAQGDLNSVIELWLGAKEIGRLAARLDRANDSELEHLSHYVTEPAAERLKKTHPGVAAKVFRAVCMRIVDAGKSKYYDEALSNLEKAKSCYQSAGLDAQWQKLVAEIRRVHSRKSGFMPGLERIVRGKGPSEQPSFLDQARQRWESRAKI